MTADARPALPHDPHWPRAGGWAAPETIDGALDAMLVGVGTHATSLSDTNAHVTPAAVRLALQRYAAFAEGADLDALVIADAGDIPEPDADEDGAIARVRQLAARSRLTIVLGGDNAATVPAALGAWGDQVAHAGLVTVDAHHDLRDGRSNGSPVTRLIARGLDPARIVQLGIQDFANSAAYTERARDLGISVVRREQLAGTDLAGEARAALSTASAGGGPVHVDIDVDVCDRAAVPACPASVPGGLSAWELRVLVRALASDPRVASIDFTEVDATRDAADERTVRLVAVLVLEALTGLAAR